MKKLLLFIIILIAASSFLYCQQGTWLRIFDWATYDISMNPLNTDNMVAGGEGRLVYRTYNGGFNWDTLIVGYRGAASRLNNIIIQPVDTNAIICGGLLFGDIRRAENQGSSPSDWKIVLSNNTNISLNGKSLMVRNDDFNVMYLAEWMSGVVYRSSNKGKSWDSISTVMDYTKLPDSSGHLVDSLTNIQVGSLAERTDSTEIFIIGSTDGKIYLSNDNAITWKKMCKLVEPADTTQSTDCEVTRIVFSKHNPKVGYACITYLFFRNFPNGGLHKTTDGGYTWHQIAFADTSLWALDVRTLNDTDEVFVGGYTEDYYNPEFERPIGVGLVRGSYDGGATWYDYDNKINWHTDYTAYLHSIRSFAYVNKDSIIMVGSNGFITRLEGTLFVPLDSSKLNISQNINSIEFANRTTGYACGDSGLIIKTITCSNPTPTDSVPWKKINNANITNDLNSISIINVSNILACGSAGTVVKSTNGGGTWFTKITNTNSSLYSIKFIDNQNGFACGANGILIKTTNAGESWNKINFPTTDTLFCIKFTKSLTGYITTSSGQIYKSTDTCSTWTMTTPTSVNTAIRSIDFIGDSTGFACGYNGTLLITHDSCKSWYLKYLYTPRNFYQLRVVTPDSIQFCGDYHTMYESTDGGYNWVMKTFGWKWRANMWSMRFLGNPGNEKLFMASEAGLFRFDEPTSVNNSIQNNTDFNVFMPDKNNIIISYKRLNPNIENTLSFKLYNLIGQLVYRQDFNSSEPEMIKREFILPNLPAGSYFAQIVESKYQSTKLVIIP